MAGIGNLLHFVGYVVAREDGQNLGRVKVKAFGFHNLDPGVVSAEDLPWAPVVDGTYGAVSTIPLIGDWVLGAFLDGREAQHPIVMGRIPGYNSQAPAAVDPTSLACEYTSRVNSFGQFPLHPALGGEGVHLLDGMVSASVESRFHDNEMVDAYKRKHQEELVEVPERNLDNRVLSSVDQEQYMLMTENGCLQIVHHTGTAIQFNDDGDILIKSRAGKQEMVDGGIVEDCFGDVNKMIGQDYTLKVDMNGKMYFGGDLDIECENFTLTSRGETTINAGAKMILNTHADMQQQSAGDFNIVSESRLKMQSIDLTTLESSNNGIYLYATGGNNNIDMTGGSIRIATEVVPNAEVEGIAEADTHHLGSIDISSANNIRMESKGTPADTLPDNVEIENSEGFIDIRASAGIRQGAAGNINIETGNDLITTSVNNTAMNATGTMGISGNAQTNLTSEGTTHIRGTTTYIDDFVRMAEAGAVSANDNRNLSTNNSNLPPEAKVAEIASKTRTTDASGEDDKKDTVIASAVNKEDLKPDELNLHGAGPQPPAAQGDNKGYKQPDNVGLKASPGQTNPPVDVSPESETETLPSAAKEESEKKAAENKEKNVIPTDEELAAEYGQEFVDQANEDMTVDYSDDAFASFSEYDTLADARSAALSALGPNQIFFYRGEEFNTTPGGE